MQHRGVLTSQAQLLYVLQWLGEFSDIEKDDFLQELLDVYAPGQLPIGRVLRRTKSDDQPPSLFQCRMDLLKQWFESWTPEGERQELLRRIRESDPEFAKRFDTSVETPNDEKIVHEFWVTNGDCNGRMNGTDGTNGHITPGDESEKVEELSPAVGRVHPDDSSTLEESRPAANGDIINPTENGLSESNENSVDVEQPAEDAVEVNTEVSAVVNTECSSSVEVEKEENIVEETQNVEESAEDSGTIVASEESAADAAQLQPVEENPVSVVGVTPEADDMDVPKEQGDVTVVQSPTKVEQNGDPEP